MKIKRGFKRFAIGAALILLALVLFSMAVDARDLCGDECQNAMPDVQSIATMAPTPELTTVPTPYPQSNQNDTIRSPLPSPTRADVNISPLAMPTR